MPKNKSRKIKCLKKFNIACATVGEAVKNYTQPPSFRFSSLTLYLNLSSSLAFFPPPNAISRFCCQLLMLAAMLCRSCHFCCSYACHLYCKWCHRLNCRMLLLLLLFASGNFCFANFNLIWLFAYLLPFPAQAVPIIGACNHSYSPPRSTSRVSKGCALIMPTALICCYCSCCCCPCYSCCHCYYYCAA